MFVSQTLRTSNTTRLQRFLRHIRERQMSKTFSITYLKKNAGEQVFLRGFQYFLDGQVKAVEPQGWLDNQAEFVVQGSSNYHVDLVLQSSGGLRAECDCRHARDNNFCKHQVAAALFWKAHLGFAQEVADAMLDAGLSARAVAHKESTAKPVSAATLKRRATVVAKQEQLQAFIQAQSTAALSARLWQWAQKDKALMAELTLWQSQQVTKTQGLSLAAVKDSIKVLLPMKDGLWGRALAIYEQQAAPLMPLLDEVLEQDPQIARKACEFALQRFFKVMQHSDNSNGEMVDLYHFLLEFIHRALHAHPPEAAWLSTWLALSDADDWGHWSDQATFEAAGGAVQQAFSKQAVEQWQAWALKNSAQLLLSEPALGDQAVLKKTNSRSRSETWAPYDSVAEQLRQRYLLAVDAAQDPVSSIQARYASARRAWDVLELAQYCEAHERQREALVYAQKAYQFDPDHSGIQDFLLHCFERDGWDEEAYALRFKQVQAQPLEARLRRKLLKAGQRMGRSKSAIEQELQAWAQARELQRQQEQQSRFDQTHKRSGQDKESAGRDVTVRVTWYLQDGESEKAYDLLRQDPGHLCQIACSRDLGLSLPPSHQREAVQLLNQVLQAQMQHASSPYQQELGLVQDILQRLPQPEQGPWLQALATQYSVKRNFIKGLPVA